jgi:hypothetical protein
MLSNEIEDLLPQSAAYRQAGHIFFAEPVSATGRPLTPLHAGHVGLLACSGLLNRHLLRSNSGNRTCRPGNRRWQLYATGCNSTFTAERK